MTTGNDVLDLLVVGGGPGGTAAAFRGRELGLSVLVVEYDDLMKRIRDYSKDKLILPGFGGGDRMQFPDGGALIRDLCFEPIDKDEMCLRWKGLYRDHRVPCRVGVELTGLGRRGDGVYEAIAWDHGGRQELRLLARHVVLAVGRGVPRRFDIPGDTDGLCLRLDDPAAYLGKPCCVIGGGTSAAEAVIALSKAKAAAGDPTSVYWSYRGDKMPRVSKALAEVFFEAYVGAGNIRYHPRSEPAAVVTGDDRREYLSIRVDRRAMDGRPAETTHLEFPKESCIACIGEDIPEAFLASLGIHMAVGGKRPRKRMVVNRFLETQRPGVYLVGDILSQAHLETDDFDADPSTFREVRHRGNIKTALRDGVRVAQVVRQRLDGVEDVDLDVADAEPLEPSTGSLAMRVAELPPPPAPSGSGAILVRLLPGGLEAEEYPLGDQGLTTLGRRDCDISVPTDNLLSQRHASILATDDGGHAVRDDGSEGGVFLAVPSRRKITIGAGDLLRLGRQFLLVTVDGGSLGLSHFDASGREVGRVPLKEGTIVLGRKAPDVTLDPADGTLSRRQLALTLENGVLLVKDLRSVNGSFLRVRGDRPLEHGDRLRVGQQTFVYGSGSEAVLDLKPGPRPQPAPVAPAPAPSPSGPAVTFQNLGQTVPVAPGQTLCEAAEAHGVKINAECHAGICGSDPIRILSGQEHLEGPPAAGECETLEDICGLEPGACRLACMARVTGPVVVEIL
ncbi:MAG: FAD-dependent oxidoreductase [Acidobacteriota bacterium]